MPDHGEDPRSAFIAKLRFSHQTQAAVWVIELGLLTDEEQ